MKNSINEALKKYFGYTTFKANQEEIVRASLDGKDIFAAMPTGGGKSLCYQLPAVLSEGIIVVVSPLIALMKDQVDGAAVNGIPSGFINSALSAEEAVKTYREMYSGALKLLYVAPERIFSGQFLEKLKDLPVSRFAVDEAHCISEWGHEFRPDYRQLSKLRAAFPGVPISAFTATATKRVQSDIIRLLKLKAPLKIRASFNRKELSYRVVRKDDPRRQVLDFIRAHPGKAGIVYRTSRKDVEAMAAFLSAGSIRALPYHAGFEPEVRKKHQEAFKFGEVDVIVATIAFGMGIDKADIRYVIHADLPKSIESYYQETGRAGRDGDPAECLLLYSPGDTAKIRYFIKQMKDTKERERAEGNLRKMRAYAESGVCRRKQLLAYFDEEHPDTCGNCDVCNGEIERADATEDAQKLLSAVVRTGERFGINYIIDVVKGKDDERIRRYGHHKLPTYGVGKDRPRKYWHRIMDELLMQECLYRDVDNYGVLSITERGKEVLFGRSSFTVVKRQEPRRAAEPALLPAGDEKLFERLKNLRYIISRAEGIPPYRIFSDKTLRDMCRRLPRSTEEFLAVHGVGKKKLDMYGDEFLQALRDFPAKKRIKTLF